MERVLISGTGSELQGVGRMADGRAVFVPGVLPGEEAEIEIVKESARWCEGRAVRIINASEAREEPDCAYYGQCGGCVARHMSYAYSLELKQAKVRDALKRIGGIEDPKVFPVIGCESPDHSRNKAEYAVGVQNGHAVIGSFAARSHRIIQLDTCSLQKEISMRAVRTARRLLDNAACLPHVKYIVTRVNRQGEMSLTFACDAPVIGEIRRIAARMMEEIPQIISCAFCKLKFRPSHALDGSCEIIAGAKTITDVLLGLKFELSPQSFFQVDPEQAEKLYLCALEAANINKNSRVIDAYCGAGTITLSAARIAAHVTGVEIVAPAIENARRNAEMNGLSAKARFICGDAAVEIPKLIRGGTHFDAAILDPPRKGADEALVNAIAAAKIPVVSYVSCDPATLARDVKRFIAQGYRFEYAQPVDMFARTEHVETVCLLSKLSETKHHIEINLDMDELDVTASETKATYQEIKDYILEKHGVKVSSLYIAQVKEKYRIIERDCYNKPKKPDAKQPQCPADKEKIIVEALKHFQMI